MPNESEPEFEQLREAYICEFQPSRPSETDLREELVAADVGQITGPKPTYGD